MASRQPWRTLGLTTALGAVLLVVTSGLIFAWGLARVLGGAPVYSYAGPSWIPDGGLAVAMGSGYLAVAAGSGACYWRVRGETGAVALLGTVLTVAGAAAAGAGLVLVPLEASGALLAFVAVPVALLGLFLVGFAGHHRDAFEGWRAATLATPGVVTVVAYLVWTALPDVSVGNDLWVPVQVAGTALALGVFAAQSVAWGAIGHYLANAGGEGTTGARIDPDRDEVREEW